VRKFLFLVLTSLAVVGAHAWEPTSADSSSEEALAPPSYAETLVTIAPVPLPATVVEIARYSPKSTGIGHGKRAKAAKVARVKSILSRSAREQIALAAKSARPEAQAILNASDHEDVATGIDELDLHRSFSQPKVARTSDQASEDDEADSDLSDHVKLRLLIARTKAVEAHILSQAGKAADQDDSELSETVKLRLLMARTRALQAYAERFGSTSV
jgi:hypothetical protein